MPPIAPRPERQPDQTDVSIGRIVSVTGAKSIVLLDGGLVGADKRGRGPAQRPEMGTLFAIETTNTVVLAIVSALSVPVPAQREGESELWIAELGLVGELWKGGDGRAITFNRGVTVYPALGDRVRVASRQELEQAFCGDRRSSVRVGCIRQDPTIAATIRVDDLLGKHFAILGTTGTGKSCTTALILRSILQKNPAAHIVLLDPHNEYAPAFGEWAEVISQRNMQLPYWLLTFEELVEVLIGNPQERKAEVEILQELIPLAKARYGTGRGNARETALRRATDIKYTVDTPVPYRTSDLIQIIDDRMGRLENKRDLSPYRNLKTRLEIISADPRYAFMFGSLTVIDSMAQILGRIFRVPVNDKPITIFELTGLPTEIINVVVSVLCRMTFDFALWSEGQVPVMLVCEEAHRYVPAKSNLGFEPCKRAIAKIAKEGRKYGASLCIVTQRPAEIDPTILSQCNTVFALRMSNDSDQEIVKSAIADTGSGLLEFLSALGQREAIAFGDGVTLPVRIRFDELPKHCMPRSSTARFTEKWQRSVGDEGFLESIVDRWRNSSSAPIGDASQHMALLAESLNLPAGASADAGAAAAATAAGDEPARPDLPPIRAAPRGRARPPPRARAPGGRRLDRPTGQRRAPQPPRPAAAAVGGAAEPCRLGAAPLFDMPQRQCLRGAAEFSCPLAERLPRFMGGLSAATLRGSGPISMSRWRLCRQCCRLSRFRA